MSARSVRGERVRRPECSICIGDIAPGPEAQALECGHTFHYACIAQWERRRNLTCPNCREPLFMVVREGVDEQRTRCRASVRRDATSSRQCLHTLADGPGFCTRHARARDARHSAVRAAREDAAFYIEQRMAQTRSRLRESRDNTNRSADEARARRTAARSTHSYTSSYMWSWVGCDLM